MNRAMMSMLCLNESAAGSSVLEFLDIKEISEAIATGELKNVYSFIPETQLYVDVTIKPIPEHNLCFAIFRDMTKEIEQKENIQDEFEQKEERKAKISKLQTEWYDLVA